MTDLLYLKVFFGFLFSQEIFTGQNKRRNFSCDGIAIMQMRGEDLSIANEKMERVKKTEF